MAETSQFWNSTGVGDGPVGGYTMADWNDIWNKLYASGQETTGGILRGVSNELAISGIASPVTIATGAAIVNGWLYENTTALTLTVTTPTLGTTGGHIILRINWAAQTVRAFAIRNTDGIGTIPALTQVQGTTWEIRLASFTITVGGVITLTDTRVFAQFATNHVKRTGDTMTGQLFINPGGTTNTGIDIGSTAGVSTPFLDFHSSGNNNDYDARLIASGGAAGVGQGSINIVLATLLKNGFPLLELIARQGGSATDWQSPGTTTRNPTLAKVQVGIKAPTALTTAVVFPTAFTQPPLVFVQSDSSLVHVVPQNITAAGFNFGVDTYPGTTVTAVSWLAIGQ